MKCDIVLIFSKYIIIQNLYLFVYYYFVVVNNFQFQCLNRSKSLSNASFVIDCLSKIAWAGASSDDDDDDGRSVSVMMVSVLLVGFDVVVVG